MENALILLTVPFLVAWAVMTIGFFLLMISPGRVDANAAGQRTAKIPIWFTYALLLAIASTMLLGILMIWSTGFGAIWVWVIVFSALCLVHVIPTLSPSYELTWDHQRVAGISKTAFLRPPKNNEIEFKNISSMGTIFTGEKYIETPAGDRVLWSFTFLGAKQFRKDLEAAIPDLF